MILNGEFKIIKIFKSLLLILSLICISSCNKSTNEITNEKVKIIKHITSDYKHGDSQYFAFIENKVLKIKYLNLDDLFPKKCIKSHPVIRKNIISYDPLIISCLNKEKYADDINPFNFTKAYRIITNGDWVLDLKQHQTVIGSNNQHTLLSDYSMINHMTGKISKDNASFFQRKLNRISQVVAATVSSNNRLFIFDMTENNISEILTNGTKTKIINLPKKSNFGIIPYVDLMATSENGNYIYLLLSETVRGPFDLYFYIIETNSKSTIYRKKLESKANYRNLYLKYENGNVIFGYKNNYKDVIDFYWVNIK